VTKRAATASQLFGDDVGRKLLPLLIKGADGIRDLRMEAQIFGGVLTEEDSVAAENLTHDLRLLGYMMRGLKTQIGLALIPEVQDLVTATLEWVDVNKEWLQLKIGQGIDVVTAAFRALTSPLGMVVVGFGALQAAWGAAKAVQALTAALGMGAGGLGVSVAALASPVMLAAVAALIGQDLYNAMRGIPSVTGDAAAALGAGSEFQLALIGLRDNVSAALVFVGALGPAVAGMVGDLISAIPGLERFNDAMSYAASLMPEAPPGGWMQGAADLFERSAGGYRKAASYLSSEDPEVRNAALTVVRGSMNQAFDPFGAFGLAARSKRSEGEAAALQTLGRAADDSYRESMYYGNMGAGPKPITVTINANGLSASEAEAMSRRVIREELVEAYDAGNGGLR
jgi:hypothetical protein